MGAIFSADIFISALELGCIYSFVAMALYISFTILNIADLSTDGCFTLGCAVCAVVTISGHPYLAIPAAMLAGVCSGFITAMLQTKMGVESILAGIIVNTALYTINIFVMGKSNLNIFGQETMFVNAKKLSDAVWYQKSYKLIIAAVLVVIAIILISWFLNTKIGLSIRATGDNPMMVKASSINPGKMITTGLCISSALTDLSGAVLAQYQKSCDINFGTGQVTIALASLVIGTSIISHGSVFKRVLGVVMGSCLYRVIIAVALRFHLPGECLKLVSAIIVAVAISAPYLTGKMKFVQQKNDMLKAEKLEGIGKESDR